MEKKSLSTSLYTIWNVAGQQLKISAMDDALSIAIWNPQVSPEGRMQYPAEGRISIILNMSNLNIINTYIRNDIIEAYSKEEFCKRAVYTNNAHSTIFEVETNNGEFMVNIYRDIDPTSNIPKYSYSYRFDASSALENYKPESGEAEYCKVQGDFLIFAMAITGFVRMSPSFCQGSGLRYHLDNKNKRYMNYLTAIANAVHAQLPAENYGYQNNNGYSNNYRNNNDYVNTSNNETVTTNNSEPAYTQVETDLMDLT